MLLTARDPLAFLVHVPFWTEQPEYMSWPGSQDLQIQLEEVEGDKPPVKAARVSEILSIVLKYSKVSPF